MRSVRQAAKRRLRSGRRSVLRGSGAWRWRSGVPGLRWVLAVLGSLSVRGQVASAALWLAVLTAVSYLPVLGHGRLHLSISTANTSLLSTLWQVQATSVGLVLALVVFVFGLLPQGRGRLTYREFLRRTWALPLTTANVASLLFIGMVLLGLGHQDPSAGSVSGSGWAVTLASCVSLLSIATIVLVLAQTLKAISREAQGDAQRDYQLKAVDQAARDELIERMSVRMMSDPAWPYAFASSYPVPGRTISVAGLEAGVVRDVSTWRLRILKQLAERRQHVEPTVRAWPGRTASAGTPLMTIDLTSGPLEAWWAARCVRTRRTRSDALGSVLAALHGEALEHIRTGRQTEAVEGMRSLFGLQELLWQAYTAYGQGLAAGGPAVLYGKDPGERIDSMLGDLLRTAAVSMDEAVRREAGDLPRVIAREALYREDRSAVWQLLRHLEGVYIAVVGELSGGGLRDLPATGLARSRLHHPFRSLLSFVNYYLGSAIDQAIAGGTTGWDGRPLPPADFLLARLQDANEAMLRLLRRAIQFRDSVTVARVLDAWKLPDMPLARDAISRAPGAAAVGVGSTAGAAPGSRHDQSLKNAQADLDAMMLRLLGAALDAERAAYRETPQPNAQLPGEEHADREKHGASLSAVTDAVLARLPVGRLWDTLERALETASGDWRWEYSDDEIIPAGVVDVRSIDTVSPLIEAFSLAVVAHPALVGGTVPDRRLILDRGPGLVAEITGVPSAHGAWLLRHGCTPEHAASNATALKDQIDEAMRTAQHELEEEIRGAPVRQQALGEVHQAGLAAFREQDTAARLFAWANSLVSKAGKQSVSAALNASRRDLIGDSNGMTRYYGQRLGGYLAWKALAQLLLAVSQAGEKATVRPDDISAAVRDAITQLSSGIPAGAGQNAPASRTAVFIPDIPYGLRNDLQITQAQGPDARSLVARQLGLYDDSLASQITGTIEGVPVFVTSALEGRVLAVDLGRFGDLLRPAPGGTQSSDPELDLHEPADPLRPSAGPAPGASPAEEAQIKPLEVQLVLGLPTEIEVKDASAARVIKFK